MTKLSLAGVVTVRMIKGTISQTDRNKQHSCAFFIENATKNKNKVLKWSVGCLL